MNPYEADRLRRQLNRALREATMNIGPTVQTRRFWKPLDAETPLLYRNSSIYPDDVLKRLVKFAAHGLDTAGWSIWVKNLRAGGVKRGRAYTGKGYCNIAIGPPKDFPRRGLQYPGLKTAPVYDLENWAEAVVYVTAHELRHLVQARLKTGYSEIDACNYGVKRLNAYRMLLRGARTPLQGEGA